MGRLMCYIRSLFNIDNSGSSIGNNSSVFKTKNKNPTSTKNLEKSNKALIQKSRCDADCARRRSAMQQCSIFAPPLPYASYESYNSNTRMFLNTGAVHIYKTALSEDAMLPLEDKGLGRIKAIYEAWFSKHGSLSRDKISGIFVFSFVNANMISGTISCGGSDVNRTTAKHYVQCLYAGTGVRRKAHIDDKSAGCMGAELWIKASMPLTQAWVQSMHIPPTERLNRMCLLAAPSPDFTTFHNGGNELAELPMLSAGQGNPVFELDSDVYVYVCRLIPCASVCYTAQSAAKSAKEPPIFEFPNIRRVATISTVHKAPSYAADDNNQKSRCSHKGKKHGYRHCQNQNKQVPQPNVLKPGKTRSVFIHLLSDFNKIGTAKDSGACLMLPGSIQLSGGDSIHLQNVIPGSEIIIKSSGFDRAQFLLVDMPAYDDEETKSI
ncbi:hypothetical protein GGF37_003029 [Kickxella alabastrina]|nr:hypothetical protein GGF37_003029 [Kickxella alabastrina]